MSRWRPIILLVLLLLPVLFLMAMGSVYLWTTKIGGVSAWLVLWWPSLACLSVAFLLAWWWQRQNRLLAAPELPPSPHWTERDHQAWNLVEARTKSVQSVGQDQFLEVQFYFDTARNMAEELARFYHPRSKDPFGPLTIPEILAVAHLAAEDLTELVNGYLPGGHMLTINHWRTASKLTDWYSHARATYWVISALYSPINTAARFAASKVGISRPLDMLGENLKVWFYTAFVHRVGHYLIELNSGRLRVGAKRYRELLRSHGMAVEQRQGDKKTGRQAEADVTPLPPHPLTSIEVTITLLGRVKAGKSSLINALLGERLAGTDVLPLTDTIARYELSYLPPHERTEDGRRSSAGVDPSIDNQTRLVLLDTVGYGHEGPKADQLQATIDAVLKSDIALLVMHGRDPARQQDVEQMQKLRGWFQARPQFKMPPILGVLTHVDLLSPMMEWAPPYDYLQPRRPKEKSIHDAVAATREQFGDVLLDVVPVCTAEGKTFGVHEWLLPYLVENLGEARAVALLRCLHAEIDEGKVRRVFEQLLLAGKQLYHIARQK